MGTDKYSVGTYNNYLGTVENYIRTYIIHKCAKKYNNCSFFSFKENNRPKLDPTKPEERSYYAYYVEDDEEVGLQSDIVTVVVP